MGRRIGGLVVLVFALVASTAHATTPAVVFDSTPPAESNQTSWTFKWHGSGPFKCSLDGAAFSACTSPKTVPTPPASLAEGNHTFSVQGTGTGTSAPPPVSYTWHVDLTPPTTDVTAQPPALTNSKTATFVFSSPSTDLDHFECSLNGSLPQTCSSPVVYNGLSDSTRTLLIQAVDHAGNHDTQAQPITWTVDTAPPDTTLANPGNIVANSAPDFTFTATEAGSTFQCSFDSGPFAACTSPDRVDVLKSGHHEFAVRATDVAGNVDPTPAGYSWTSDQTPPKRPKVTIFAAPSAKASAAPVLKVTHNPGLGLTFTDPLSALLSTPTFTLSTRLHAQWKSDSTATSYDVTVTTYPEDSTGMDERGDDVLTIKQYSHTKRTALTLKPGTGATVCVKTDARDKVGNVSETRTACTTIPDSFAPPWGPYAFHRVKDSKAWRHYYIVIRSGAYLDQPIGDGAFFAPSRAVLVAERCHGCGSVEFAFTKYPVGGHKFHQLAVVDLNGKTDHQMTVDVKLPHRRLESDGNGYVVLLRLGGKPRVSGVGFTN